MAVVEICLAIKRKGSPSALLVYVSYARILAARRRQEFRRYCTCSTFPSERACRSCCTTCCCTTTCCRSFRLQGYSFAFNIIVNIRGLHCCSESTVCTYCNASNIFTFNVCRTCNTCVSITCRPFTFICVIFDDCGFLTFHQGNCFRNLRTTGVVLVSRQSDNCQNTDNCDYDHQFDQGETFLDCFHLINSSLKSVVNKNVCC